MSTGSKPSAPSDERRRSKRTHDGSEDRNSDGAHGGSGAENQPVDREECRRGYGGERGGGGEPDKKQRNTLHNEISHTRVSPQIVPTEHQNVTQNETSGDFFLAPELARSENQTGKALLSGKHETWKQVHLQAKYTA